MKYIFLLHQSNYSNSHIKENKTSLFFNDRSQKKPFPNKKSNQTLIFTTKLAERHLRG